MIALRSRQVDTFGHVAASRILSVLGLSVTGRVAVCLAAVSFALVVAGLLSYAISEEPIVQEQHLQTTFGIIRKTDPVGRN